MSKVVIAGGILLLIIVFGFAYVSNKQEVSDNPSSENQLQPVTKTMQDEVVDKQASFAIFTNGTFRVFTASMYHNLSVDSYIESSNPNIVLVKKAGVTWNDFFSTLPFTLTPECLTTGTKETFCTGNRGTLKFYVNGEQSNNALRQEIKDGDKLLVTFGTESEAQIKQQIDRIP